MEIYQITNRLGQKLWKTFSKHHYLSGNLSKQANCFIGIYDNKLVGFCAVKQLAYHKGKKSIHRLVILPEFQGIGFGTKFLDEIAYIYIQKNWQVHITTSNKGLIYSLYRNNHWKFLNKTLNRVQMGTLEKKLNKRIKYKGGSNINNCFTREITSFKTNKKIWNNY